jgi:hypothetical protein
MKGQSMQIEEMTKLFFVIFVFAFALLIIIGASGGLTSVLSDFCLKNPKWCGNGTSSENEVSTSINSVKAMICAIGSVSQGEKVSGQGCLQYYQSSMTQGSGYPSVVCSGMTENSVCCQYASNQRFMKEILSESACQEKGGRTIAKPLCQTPEASCQVYNFSLPQKVSNAEQWIEGFGDPRFLVYYIQFPAGAETSWSGWSEWFKGSDVLLFASMCVSKIALFSGVGGYKAVTNPLWVGKKVIQVPIEASRGVAYLATTLKKVVSEGADVSADIIGSATRKEMIEKLAVYTGVIKLELREKSWNTFKEIAPRTAVYTAAGAEGALMASRVDYEYSRFFTEMGKFVPNEGYFVLQEALNKQPLLEEKPSIVSTGGSGYTDAGNENIIRTFNPILLKTNSGYQPLYLASPCASDLKVSKENDVKCIQYNHNSLAPSVFCEAPDTQGWDESLLNTIKPCGSTGVFYTGFKDRFSAKLAEIVTQGLGKTQIFQDTDSDGKNDDVATDPVLGFTFEIETDPSKIVCCSDNNGKYFNWLERGYCQLEGGKIVENAVCESSVQGTLIKTKPAAIIKKISHPSFGESASYPKIIGNSFPYSCHNITINYEDIKAGRGFGTLYDVLLFGNGNSLISCYPPIHEFKNTLGSVLQSGSSEIAYPGGMEIVFNVSPDGAFKNLQNLVVMTSDSTGQDILLLSDTNYDGKVDGASGFYVNNNKALNIVQESIPMRVFIDSNYDGSVDILSSSFCRADSIIIETDKTRYGNSGANFCYSGNRRWVGIGSTVISFALDAAVKRIPTPATWFFGTAADCYLAYKTADWATPDWPQGE